ncbi:MAG: acyl-ACP thioesterase [Alistipes sp.]|nr:acyl-ACP thioesterase [Alistipes sp.]
MAEKTLIKHTIEPQYVDYTLRATLCAVGNFMLDAAGSDAHNKGFGIDVLLPQYGMTWVLSRMTIELDRRPAQYEEVVLRTWVNENTRLISTRNFELVDSEGAVIGRAVSQWCLLNVETRRVADITAFGALWEGRLCDAPSPCEAPRKVLPVEYSGCRERRVAYSDIDFNCHVNTMRYISMMVDSMPIDVWREDRSLRFDVHFLHECRADQLLRIGYAEQDNVSHFEVFNVDDDKAACRATIEWL